ncbi:(2Fe-2S)-binding protein [Burkholderiaceae bacterium FT117]|uniref:(2Fe-2S)-binding protein n=1 Tax=Zeimonas sediminis TaxID=2944268 RepID=UPI002342F37F|nr:(2Fe-2S)-binding protein [Zeimonas sediminis]MCM5569744.1 (2Fe-2S)-binding protein [Zeimonas sediminis]
MHRRGFLIGCAAAGAVDGAALAQAIGQAAVQAPGDTARRWQRALLVGEDGKPLLASRIPERTNLLFHYPFVGTPAFLLNLGKPTKREVALATEEKARYTWAGGVGPKRSIVAYSAICAHKMAYPAKEISFISYRAETSPISKRGEVIHCCAEHSQYDPADGARVLAGPATQPLAAILLEHDPATDQIYATGTQGGELFDGFFERFAMKLSLEHGGRERQPAPERCLVQPIENYCRQLMRCA